MKPIFALERAADGRAMITKRREPGDQFEGIELAAAVFVHEGDVRLVESVLKVVNQLLKESRP